MGRTVLGDGSAAANLQEWALSGRDNFGLIVGQLSSTDDHIVFLAPTLPPQEDKVELEEEEEALEEENDEDSSSFSNRSPKKEPPAPIVLSELTTSWITLHSQQLSRLLTGGLDILGIFVVCSPENLAEMTKSGKLKSFFTVLEKQTARRRGGGAKSHHIPVASSLPHGDRYLLHGCSTTKAISCRSVDAADAASGSNFKSVDVRFQDDLLESWSQIDCQLGLDCVMDIPVSKLSKCSLMKQIQQGLAPTLKELCDARVVLTRAKEEADVETMGKLPSAGACLNSVGKVVTPEPAVSSSSSSKSSRKGGGRKGQGDAGKKAAAPPLPVGGRFNASVFKMVGRRSGESTLSLSSIDCATQMVLKGTICARAHLQAKASVQESIAALKGDLMHSILTRVELLCDDMLTEADQETLPTSDVIYEMPVRIFAPIEAKKRTGISIADFMFRDEGKQDAVERIRDVTGKAVPEDALVVSAESFMPNVSKASSIESLGSTIHGNDLDTQGVSSSDQSLFGWIAELLHKHAVSVVCLGGAGVSLYSAYMHFEDAF